MVITADICGLSFLAQMFNPKIGQGRVFLTAIAE